MNPPLSGVKVLDLSAVLSGPLSTAMLSDQGADVIKIESPGGDTTRRVGPAKGDMSAMYIATNRGKRAIAVDLKRPEGREIALELARRADVVVENLRPGAMDRLGLGYADLQAVNPRIVYLSISGFGQDGPYSGARVYDAVIQAASGISASHRNQQTEEPTLLSTNVCDKLTALTAAQAICAALFARERTGQGQHVRLSMIDAAIAFQWPDAMYNHVFLDDPPAKAPRFGATQRPWKTRDGYLATNTPQQDEFVALCTGMGRPELADDPRFANGLARMRNGPALRAELEPAAAGFDTDTLLARLREAGAPVGRVCEHDEVLADPQVAHNGTVFEIDHGALGRVRLPRGAAQFGAAAPAAPRPAARLGEHTRAVLKELGHDDARIGALLAAGIVLGD